MVDVILQYTNCKILGKIIGNYAGVSKLEPKFDFLIMIKYNFFSEKAQKSAKVTLKKRFLTKSVICTNLEFEVYGVYCSKDTHISS